MNSGKHSVSGQVRNDQHSYEFFCIFQGGLSFMFARGVTSTMCSVEIFRDRCGNCS